ncbi:hypothetical protein NEFER03_1325 [Nematocida sp. LUAm3]|nr:hypothetical protein NEFER03_1325 [Nematocida sp. LUAm3]KAI5174053.1 hypothetical protein NEFER02_0520 [Nematocida sp. LUAm2]KAI5177204.1 hypothetical protein NEFER01_0479 [Nematocida sp. LUAm1]
MTNTEILFPIEEILKNLLYYVDSLYNRISEKNKSLSSEDLLKKRNSLRSFKAQKTALEEEIKSLEEEIGSLEEKRKKLLFSSIDLSELLSRVVEKKDEVIEQKAESSQRLNVLSFVNRGLLMESSPNIDAILEKLSKSLG